MNLGLFNNNYVIHSVVFVLGLFRSKQLQRFVYIYIMYIASLRSSSIFSASEM